MAVHVQTTWERWAGLKQWVRVFEIHAYNLLHYTHTYHRKALVLFPTDHLLKPLLPHKPPHNTKKLISKHSSGALLGLDQHI